MSILNRWPTPLPASRSMTSTDETNSVSPIFTMPCGWKVRNAIGTDATSVHVEVRVSVVTRSATIDRASDQAAANAAITGH